MDLDKKLVLKRGVDYSFDADEKLTDKYAELVFSPSYFNGLRVDFGYTSDSGRWYGRGLNMDISEVEKLINFLEEWIEHEKEWCKKR